MATPVKHLITHSGSFHADDVFSYVVLSTIFPEARILRTRDNMILEEAGEDAIIFDVGMKFSAEARRYDHHQKEKPAREDGAPYSSIGLIWKFHGKDYITAQTGITDQEKLTNMWNRVDSDFIYMLDCADNGVYPAGVTSRGSAVSISGMIENLNPVFDDPVKDYDAAFMKASDLCRNLLEARIASEAALERSRSIVIDALQSRSDKRIMELPFGMDWAGTVFDQDDNDLLYVVYPAHGHWYCSAVKTEPGTFENRKSLPEHWAGLRDENLASASGVHDAIFCHEKLFICVAETRQGILDMVEIALDHDLGHERSP
jgi:uncharacterized UPF0160 family protein